MTIETGPVDTDPAAPAAQRPFVVDPSIDAEPENWLSRGIGTFLGLAISLAAVGGVVGLLLMHGRH